MHAREKEILTAIDAFFAEHARWVAEGDNAEYITQRYSDALDAMLGVWRGGGIPESFSRRLVAAIGGVESELFKFDSQEDDPHPKDSFWRAIEDLEKAMAAPEEEGFKSSRPAESIKMLDQQDVPHPQIAKMWGLIEPWPNGIPRLDLVQKELEKPGSVITADYEHPADAQARKEYEEHKKYTQSLVAQQQQRAAEEERDPVCPETSFDLWAIGRDGGTPVTLDQAAKMLGRPRDEIAKEWQQFDADAQNELDEPPGEDLDALKTRAKELGIGFNHKTKADVLREKITQAEANLEGVS